jgi:glucosamine-phosphate N-acetyltransferase
MYNVVPLTESDYYNGFLQLLEQLTTVGADDITYEEFTDQLKKLKSYVVVIRNDDGTVIGTASIFIEEKFIHKLSSVGHIEDVVVDQQYRGIGLGKLLIDHCIDYAKNNGCYKVLLNCSDENAGFYEKCGFKKKEVEMVVYF